MLCNALQVNEEGKPVLDLAHVIECLNKLEVGSSEKVLLVCITFLVCLYGYALGRLCTPIPLSPERLCCHHIA